jgi:protein SCO1/2
MVAGVLALVVVAGCGGSAPDKPPASMGTALDRPLPAAIANLPLTTASGAKTTLAAYHGKTVVVGDTLTLCAETCPMTSANFDQMARAHPALRVEKV